MPRVYIEKIQYEDKRFEPLIFDWLERLAGRRIRPGARVLIKPNLLMPARPETAITTHPKVVRAVARFALQKGAQVRIGDSPAVGTFKRAYRTSGCADALQDLPVEAREFTQSIPLDIGPPFHRIEIARDAIEADLIFNLAKLKTHTLTLLTLGVKNMFGCVVGLKKPQWHLKVGTNRRLFARLLVQICQALSPAVTLIDGITALQGQGPGRSGRPCPLGIIAAGDHAPALDREICRFLAVDPERLPTTRAAEHLGLLQEPVQVTGACKNFAVFDLPALDPPAFGPLPAYRFLRSHMLHRPVVDAGRCRLCDECRRYCPAAAIQRDPYGTRIDYDRCIRCYCCLEICPHGAVRAVQSRLGRVLQLAVDIGRKASMLGRRR